jgi:methylmalonyl-CoA mutase
MKTPEVYKPQHHIRIVTAASLFDGHDAAINIMRRILQSSGAEVIHLGHNRSVQEVVDCAIQEDVQAIALTSYQGGHNEYFKYMFDLLRERNSGHIKIFGGGGGVILPHEIADLHDYGIARIYSPDDGREMTLQGMINDLLMKCDFPVGSQDEYDLGKVRNKDYKEIAGLISAAENYPEKGRAGVGTAQIPETLKLTAMGMGGEVDRPPNLSFFFPPISKGRINAKHGGKLASFPIP